MNSETIALIVVAPLLAAVIANILHGKKGLRTFTLVAVAITAALTLITPYGSHFFGGYERDKIGGGLSAGIIYVFSQNHRILTFTLTLIAFLAIASYTSAFKKLSGPYLGFMMLGVAATCATIMADDFFNFYVFMEIALISQATLAISQATLGAYKSALKYLIIANVCGNCLLLGVALLLSLTGSVNVSDIVEAVVAGGQNIIGNPVFLAAAALIVFAWTYASGAFPFHNIKSELYASAMPHASALMQTQTKFIMIALAGIILRIFGTTPFINKLMLIAAVLAMVFGVIMALKQDDYQKMLSYHAISQAGYVAAGLTIGTSAAVAAGIFHAINNALYKSALFFGCECVKNKSGTTGFRGLGAMAYSMPAVAGLMLIAKLAISGVPPFNGFQSKLSLMFAAADAGMWEISLIMLLVSVLTFISMMKSFHLVFMRPREETAEYTGHAPTKSYMIALIVLVGLCVIIGLYPALVTDNIQTITHQFGLVWR